VNGAGAVAVVNSNLEYSYRLQPIHVDDLADLAVEKAEEMACGVTDAIGSETSMWKEWYAKHR
jgi:hypothetical protein